MAYEALNRPETLTFDDGSTVALADSSGTVQTSYTYDPFGTPTVTGATSSNTQQYAGRETDGTGLQYNRVRYYSPTLQRFISADPLGFGGGDVNLYAYAGNDPINATDPSGQSSSDPTDRANQICSEMGWYCQGMTSGVARDIVNGNATEVDPFDPVSAFKNGSTADQAFAVVSLVGGGGEEAAGADAVHGAITEAGLTHSLDEHASQWFGRQVFKAKDMDAWRTLVERAAQSTKVVEWKVGDKLTFAHLAQIDGKYFLIQFAREGSHEGDLVTAFAPNQDQLSRIFYMLKGR